MKSIFFNFDFPRDFLESREDEVNKLLGEGYFIKKNSLEIDSESYDNDYIYNDYKEPPHQETSFKLELVKEPETIILKEKNKIDLDEKTSKLVNTGWNEVGSYYNENADMFEKKMCFGASEFFDYKKIRFALRTARKETYEHFSGIYYDYKSEVLNHIGFKKIQNFTLNGKAIETDQLDKQTQVFWQFNVYYWDFEDAEFLNKKIKKVDNYEDGTPQKISHYMNGEKHGEFLDYNGDYISKRCFYHQGKKTGLHESWRKDKLIEKANYKDGLLHGEYFFDNRNIPFDGSGEKQTGQYYKGKESGQWEIINWRNFITVGRYNNGKKDKEWITYFPGGEKRFRTTYYEDGVKINEN